jgi:hypothetical protein
MKKNVNKIIFAGALIAGIALLSGYAAYTCKKAVSDMACSKKGEVREEKILQSDLPFLESLTRHFLTLYH